MCETKYPDVEVELLGQDGNAYAILGAVRRAMRRHNVDEDEIEMYLEEAKSGDYDNLLAVTQEYVTVV